MAEVQVKDDGAKKKGKPKNPYRFYTDGRYEYVVDHLFYVVYVTQ